MHVQNIVVMNWITVIQNPEQLWIAMGNTLSKPLTFTPYMQQLLQPSPLQYTFPKKILKVKFP